MLSNTEQSYLLEHTLYYIFSLILTSNCFFKHVCSREGVSPCSVTFPEIGTYKEHVGRNPHSILY
jgi:hypothetical protein